MVAPVLFPVNVVNPYFSIMPFYRINNANMPNANAIVRFAPKKFSLHQIIRSVRDFLLTLQIVRPAEP